MSTPIRRLLALVGDNDRSDAVLALATHLAARHGATVSALHAVAPLVMGAGGYLSPEAAGLAIQYGEQADQERHAKALARVERAAARAGLTIPLQAAEGDPLPATLAAAARSDLVLLAQHEEGDGLVPGFAGSLLVRSGTPLLFVPGVDVFPHDADGSPRCGRRVLVAWSPARETVRALRDALPLLAAAESVELVRLGEPVQGRPEPLDAVRDYLRVHGVPAEARVLARGSAPIPGGLLWAGWTPDVPVAEALLSHAADTGADLIVMGGYGHARAWELALGGVTRTMLKTMTVPVLMSH